MKKLIWKTKIKRGLIRIFLFNIIVFSALNCQSQNREVKLVKTAYENYKSAILNSNGHTAIKYLDSRTIKYYSDILEHVKSSDSISLERLNPVDKMIVLAIRHLASEKEILSFNGEKLIIYSLNKGLVGKDGVMQSQIGDVQINDKFATGEFIVNQKIAPFKMHFYKEDNQWKLDLTSLYDVTIVAFKNMINNSGYSENEFLYLILENLSGIKPESNIWRPID